MAHVRQRTGIEIRMAKIMAIYDVRGTNKIWPETGPQYPCEVFDAKTGEKVEKVFYYDSDSHLLKRHACEENGIMLLNEDKTELIVIEETRELRFIPK